MKKTQRRGARAQWVVGVWEYWSAGFSMHPPTLQYSTTPICLRWGEAIERNRSLEDFFSLLNSLAHPSLGSLDRCAVPFEGLLDFPGQGRFAERHIVHFFESDLHVP